MCTYIHICPVGNVLYHTYIKLKNTFLFFNNYFNMLQKFVVRFPNIYIYLFKNKRVFFNLIIYINIYNMC